MAVSLTELQVGAVLKTRPVQADFPSHTIRVLAFDEIEILYDGWWPHKNDLGLTKLTGKAYYGRLPTDYIWQHSSFLRVEPLTTHELSVHRPDLPLRLCRSAKVQWSSTTYPTLDAYLDALVAAGLEQEIDCNKIAIALPEVVLAPFGPKGGGKQGKVVKANNQAGFTAIELLWLAHNLQAPHSPGFNTGVGIYRAGIQGGKPSFYVWGNYDKAGYLGRDKTFFGHFD